jgi:hypothetical protein
MEVVLPIESYRQLLALLAEAGPASAAEMPLAEWREQFRQALARWLQLPRGDCRADTTSEARNSRRALAAGITLPSRVCLDTNVYLVGAADETSPEGRILH